jgi:hypothetical protein
MLLGITLGLLIGLLTSVLFVFLLKALVVNQGWATELKIIGEVLAIPTFWFGGPWLATKVLANLNWSDHIDAYAASLAWIIHEPCSL